MLTEDLLHLTFPRLRGFSFNTKKWGEMMVDTLRPIVFDPNPMAKLIVAEQIKANIRHLVVN